MAASPAVLILIPSDPLRLLVSEFLSSLGYAPKAVATSEEATEFLDGADIDVAIIEYVTPDVAVAGLLRRLTVPIVLVTESDAVRQLPHGAIPVIADVLPRNCFSLAQLDNALSKTLRHR